MRVVCLAPGFDDPEASAASVWCDERGLTAASANPNEWRRALTQGNVAWCHCSLGVPVLSLEEHGALSRWVALGGCLLLSRLATPLAVSLGAPGRGPLVELPRVWQHADDPLWTSDFRDWPEYPHIRGIQGWPVSERNEQHHLFDGFLNGTFTWYLQEGDIWSRTYYSAPQWPDGEVLGVDRAYVALDASTAVAWEHTVGEGRILCVGANISLGVHARPLLLQRDRLLMNALEALDSRARKRGESWRLGWPGYPRRNAAADVEGRIPVVAPRVTDAREPPLAIEVVSPDASPIILGGPRSLAIGTERDGIRELWIHPVCIWSEAQPWSVGASRLVAERAVIEPRSVTRDLFAADGGRWREIALVSDFPESFRLTLEPLDHVAKERSPELSLALRLRLQWPMPGDALHPLRATLRREGFAWNVLVQCNDEERIVLLLIDGAAECSVSASESEPELRFGVAPGATLSLAVRSSPVGIVPALTQPVGARLQSLSDVLEHERAEIVRQQAEDVRIGTPSSELNEAWAWALARLATYKVLVPGVGSGFMAGYAASHPGWSDSRPGYAWFFGRDACWTADALLASGRFADGKHVLESLAQWRDVSGKIPHEVTTSGVAHYDAADATPLWLRLVAAYGEWTGDLTTLRERWGDVHDAVRYVLSTDSLRLRLPANTNVGHGWIESGALGGGAVTAYSASIWIDALRRLAPIARTLGDTEFATMLDDEHHAASVALHSRLRDEVSGRLALHMYADGTLNTTLTALSAVPILLGVEQDVAFSPSPSRAHAVLSALAHPRFSAPWGVRLIPNDSPDYRPRGYHEGAVWPLFTGWVSWAEFMCDMPDAALEHLMRIARLPQHRAKGCFDEVLDGDTGEGAGVCADQAWSAALLIAPVLHGMLGLRPCAPEGRCTITPRWPASWNHASVRNLRVGETVFSFEMRRVNDAYRYTLTHHAGNPLAIRVEDGRRAFRDVHLTKDDLVTFSVQTPKAGSSPRDDGQR